MISTQSPDRTSAHAFRDSISLEARHVRGCARAAMLAGRDVSSSDGVPADQQNGEAIRRALVEPTLDAMVRAGWTLSQSNRPAPAHHPGAHTNWEPLPGVRLYGVPDAIGAGEITGGRDAVIASASGPGLTDFYSGRCAAAVHAHHECFGGKTPPLVLASLDGETGQLHEYLLDPSQVDWLNEMSQRTLRPLAEAIITGQLPDRMLDASSPECRSCPWRSMCRPDEPKHR